MPRKRSKLVLPILGVLAVIAVMVVTSVGASLAGVELHRVEKDIGQIEEVNRGLKEELVMRLSLTEVSKSVEGSFVSPETVIYLNKTIPVLGYAK